MDFNHPGEGGKPRVVVICGPTAVGKTAAGVALARALGGEIISADSMQVYRGMDIGTAKPTAEERSAAVHHLIDIVDPDEAFDAACYSALSRRAAAGILKAGKAPIVVGGTGLYIKAMLQGLFSASSNDPTVKARLQAEAATEGLPALHDRLASCDPQTAARLHPHDGPRILRALEVFEVTGRPISQWQGRHRFADCPFQARKMGLSIEREELYRRIDLRVDAMLAAGLEQEVRMLLEKGYGADLKPMQAIGYSHMAAYLRGDISREECIRTLKRDTRRFAKRQLTWFRADPQIHWVPAGLHEEMIRLASEFLSPSTS